MGAGRIGAISLSTMLKDLRKRFMGQEPTHQDWAINDGNFTVEHVAQRLRQFVYEEAYVASYGAGAAP